MIDNKNKFLDLQLILNSIFDLVAIVDTEGKILYCNQGFAEFVNRDIDSIIGQKCHELVHGSETYFKDCPLVASLKSGEKETRQLKLGEKYFLIIVNPIKDDKGKIIGFIHTLLDITEQKKIEEALRESEEKYRTIIENAGEAIVITQDGLVKFVNPKSYEISGYSEEELLTKPFAEFLHPEDRQQAVDLHMRLLSGEKGLPMNYQVRIIDKRGNIKWLDTNTALIKWENKPATLNFIRDITELKKAEEEKEALYKQLLHAQKMEAIGKFATSIAHDFNNILTSIKGFTQLAFSSLSENDPIRFYLKNVLASSERAEKMIKQLLAFSRKQVLEKKVININELVKGLESFISRLIGEDIMLSFNLSPDIGLVEVDPSQIENIIVNLVANAKDAMPTGGMLIIETANFEVDEEFMKSHEGAQIGQYVMLSIKDTGFGIPEEIKDRIFEPFFTTKEKGTGLGLSTVFDIVKQHGGNIWCESEIGRGTTFKILLPRIEKEREREIIEKLEDKLIKGHETVLVIDDDEKVRATVLEMLKRLGYKTLEAPNPDIALFLAQFYNNPIDLVICDVVMPGMSGPKLLSKFKSYRPDVKILYMSGYTDDVIATHGILEKGINFIQKPFSIEALSSKIREALDKKRLT
ncbi:MAG: PAS domain S-box protein [Thermodesulfovibrio sp.]|nr:PAS domain S-box protein [Thermodesulfovibrio sp.]MDW7998778.1 PAS domain S-box protein [Thermodesulfovibrio sp.]